MQTDECATTPPAGLPVEMLAELIERSGGMRLRARGTSMRPFISDGDVIHISRRTADELRIGDIAACVRDNGLVVHRLVGKRHGLVLKGDALGAPDAPLESDSLLGAVTAVETSRGTIDLTRRRARYINLFVMCYAWPFSIAMSAYGKFADSRGLYGRAFPRRMRSAAEWLPRAAAAISARKAPNEV